MPESKDVWGDAATVFARAPQGALWVVDRRVEALHGVSRFISSPRAVVMVTAGERAKSPAAAGRSSSWKAEQSPPPHRAVTRAS